MTYGNPYHPTWPEKVKAARVLFRAGKKQAVFRYCFNAGCGQKLWWFCMCCYTFPHLKLYHRVQTGKIQMSKFKWQEMRNLVDAGDVKQAKAYFK